MKNLILIAALALVPVTANADAYVGAGVAFNSVDLTGAAKGTVPASATGYNLEAGFRFRNISAGIEGSDLSGSQSGGNLDIKRAGAAVAYHFVIIPEIDSYVGAGAGIAMSHADVTTFAKGGTTTSRLFKDTSADWNVGVGSIIPIYDPIKLRLSARYQPTSMGGHADSGIVLGISLLLAR